MGEGWRQKWVCVRLSGYKMGLIGLKVPLALPAVSDLSSTCRPRLVLLS